MSSFLGNRGVRFAVWIGLGAAGVLAAPAACLYPTHTFDEPEPGTGGANNGGAGGVGGGGPAEDCDNGVDDNGDGLADCADPACGAFACVPELAAGWTGYYALFDGAAGDDPGCSGGFIATTPPPFVGNGGLVARPAVCTCSCGPAEGQECAHLDTLMININDAPCSSPAAHCGGTFTIPANWNGACNGNTYFPGGRLTCGPSAGSTCETTTGVACNASVTVGPLAATGGECAPTMGVEKPNLTWAKLGHACAAAATGAAGCNVGQLCLPRPGAPFESGVCITRDGDNSCPPGAYTSRHVFYTDAEDARDCGGCSCSEPSGGTCPTTVSVYSNTTPNTCTARVAMLPAGSCADLTGNPTVSTRSTSAPGAPTGASCTASTATPKGEATGINPKTFCCIP